MQSAQDILLKLGASLKAGRHDDIALKTPSGEPVLFRARGLQVIRSEADEIDTGNTCTLVITPSAPLVSGVLVRILQVYRPVIPVVQFGAMTGRLIEKVKAKAPLKSGSWENEACLELLAFAMEIKVPPKGKGERERPRNRQESQGVIEDPFTGEPMGLWASAISRMRSARSDAVGMRDEALEDTLGQPELVGNLGQVSAWVKIANISGLVVSGYWIPVLGPSVVLKGDTEDRVAKGLLRRGLNPQFALLALANLRLRDQLRQND
jgi:hypothetical protein